MIVVDGPTKSLRLFHMFFFFFFWEQTSSTIIGILTLRLFQCNYFQENIFTFYNVCFAIKYIVKGKYFQSAKSILANLCKIFYT